MLRFKAVIFAVILLYAVAFIGVKAEAFPAQQCTTLPVGMVSWWGGDNNTLDIEGNNNGTMMNGASYASGMVGEAFSLNGTNQYVEVPDSATLRVTTAVTLDAWINTANSSGAQPIVVKAQTSGNWHSYYFSKSSDGKLYFEVDNWSVGRYGVWKTDFALSADTWYHVAVTWQNVYGDVRDAKIYVNGVEQPAQLAFDQEYDSSFTLYYTSLPLYIGRDANGSSYFNGLIDEVEIFDRVLSSSEIADIYNAGSAGKCRECVPPPSDLASWWSGDNHTIDLAGGYNGTLYGDAGYGAGKAGQAFSLDGTGDYVFAADTFNIDGGTQATYDAWVFPTATDIAIFGVGDSTLPVWTTQQCRMLFSGAASPPGSAKFYMDCGLDNTAAYVGRSTANDYPVNAWYLVTGVFNNGSLDIYVNGRLDNGALTGNGGTSINTGAYNYVWIGALVRSDQSYSGVFFNGLIDEVEIFNRSLSANEVADIYNAGSSGKCKPFILTVNGSGNGSGTVSGTGIDCTITNGASGGDCSGVYDDGTVSLTPSADAGYTFTGWSGDCDADGQVTMDADKTCTASFECSDPYEIINDLYDDVNTGVALRSIRTRLKGTLDSCFNRMPAAIDGDVRSLNYAVRYIEQFKMYVNKYIKTGEINGKTGDGLLQRADELIASFTCEEPLRR